MRTIGVSSALVLIGAAVAGAALLPRTAEAQKDKSIQVPMIEGRLMQFQQREPVRIPLRDSSGAERATLTFIPGAGGKGAVTITDPSGARIDLLAGAELAALPGFEESRIRLPAPLDPTGKADSASDARFLKEELRKLDARIRQLEAKLRR